MLTKSDIASLATAAQAGTIIRGIPDGSFTNLTDGLQRNTSSTLKPTENGI